MRQSRRACQTESGALPHCSMVDVSRRLHQNPQPSRPGGVLNVMGIFRQQSGSLRLSGV
jgi:hypothetical protein